MAKNVVLAKHVLITGASSGIGKATAQQLVDLGVRVTGIARFENSAPLNHPLFQPHAMDLSIAGDKEFKTLAKELEDVDAIVCNAGAMLFGKLEQLAFPEIQKNFHLNFLSHVALTKNFLPKMKSRECGHLIFMGSESALKGARGGSIYCGSKFALRGFAQALRDECKSSGVRITLINPGLVRTPFFDKLPFEPGDDASNAIEVDDVAKLILDCLNMRPGTSIDEINLTPQVLHIKKCFK